MGPMATSHLLMATLGHPNRFIPGHFGPVTSPISNPVNNLPTPILPRDPPGPLTGPFTLLGPIQTAPIPCPLNRLSPIPAPSTSCPSQVGRPLVCGGGGYPPAGYRGICETMGLSPIPSISYDVSRTCLREISETSSSLSHQILVRHMMIHFIYIIIKELSECLTKTLKPGRGVSPPHQPINNTAFPSEPVGRPRRRTWQVWQYFPHLLPPLLRAG